MRLSRFSNYKCKYWGLCSTSELSRCPVAGIGRNSPAIGKCYNHNIVSPESKSSPELFQGFLALRYTSTFWNILWFQLLNWFISKEMFSLNSGCFSICDLRAVDIWPVVGKSKIFYTKDNPPHPIRQRLSNSGELQCDFICYLVWLSSHKHSDMVNDIIRNRVNTFRMDKPINAHINVDKMKLNLQNSFS